MNIAVCFLRFGPYHWARCAALTKYVSVTAVELDHLDRTYAWDEPLAGSGIARIRVEKRPGEQVPRVVTRALSASRPDVVAVPGWADPYAAATLRWCLAERIPTIVMSDSRREDKRRNFVEEAFKRRIVALHGSAVVAGDSHASYMSSLGMAKDAVFQPYDVVDNDYFLSSATKARAQRRVVQSQFGIPERYFLVCNRLIEKKNMFRVLQSFASYRKRSGKTAWNLVVAGDGHLRMRLEDMCRELGIASSVTFAGFRQYHELPVFYGLAGALIHASTFDQWGLVVNEAMACGLPVLVSRNTGAAEMVEQDVNGYLFDPVDCDELADLMTRISSLERDIARMGTASQRIVARYSPDAFARAVCLAADKALCSARRKTTPLDYLMLNLLSRRTPSEVQT